MPLEYTNVSSSALFLLWRELWRGKSIARTLLNHTLQSITVRGTVLDLGSKSNAASYNRFLKKSDGVKMTYTDLYESDDDVVMMDLEKSFPLADNSFDTITCFNTLEHIYDYNNVVRESYRVLKDGGTFIGGTPFLVNYHPDPHDYWRYTHEAIEKIFTSVGFTLERMVSLGFGPLTAAISTDLFMWPRFIRPAAVTAAILLDRLILRFKPGQRGRFPLGYVYVFSKSDM